MSARRVVVRKTAPSTKRVVKTKQTYEPRYLVSFVWLVVYLAVSVFVTQGLSLVNPGGVQTMPHVEFLILSLTSLFLGVGLVVFGRLRFGVKLNWLLIAIGAGLILVDAIAIGLFPNQMTILYSDLTSLDFVVSNIWKLRFFVTWVVSVLGLYILIAVAPGIFKSHRAMDFFLWAGVFIGVGLALISFYTDRAVYHELFRVLREDLTNPDVGFPRPKSITNQCNTFGFAMLWSLLCAIILHAKYRRWPIFATCFFLGFMVILSGSKTCIFAGGVGSLIYIAWAVITGWKKKRRAQIITMVVVVFAMAALAIFTVVPINALLPIQTAFKYLLKKMAGLSGGNFTTRTDVWNLSFHAMANHPISLAFGVGDGLWEYYLAAAICRYPWDIYSSHNGFLMVYGRFGIYGLVIYGVLLVAIVVECIRAVKDRKERWCGVILIVLITILLNSLFEDTCLIDFRLKGIMTLGITWVPLQINKLEHKAKLTPNQNKIILRRARVYPKDLLVGDTAKLAFGISAALAVISIGFGPAYKDIFGSCFYYDKYSILGLIISFALVPAIFVESYAQKRQKKNSFHIAYLILGSLLAIGSLLMASLTSTILYPTIFGGAMVVVIVVGAFPARRCKVGWKDVLIVFLILFVAACFIVLSYFLNSMDVINSSTRSIILALWVMYSSINYVIAGLSKYARTWLGTIGAVVHNVEVFYAKRDNKRLKNCNDRIAEIY